MERTVRTAKATLKKLSNSHLALLSYRTTPLPCGQLNPAQLLMGHTLRIDVSQLPAVYQLEWQYLKDFRQREEKYREDQKRNYNERHQTKTIIELPDNYPVWVDMPPNGQVPGDVVLTVAEPDHTLSACNLDK